MLPYTIYYYRINVARVAHASQICASAMLLLQWRRELQCRG